MVVEKSALQVGDRVQILPAFIRYYQQKYRQKLDVEFLFNVPQFVHAITKDCADIQGRDSYYGAGGICIPFEFLVKVL